MWYKVNNLIARVRGVPAGVSLPSPPTHQTKYSIEESVAKMIQSMYMAWGFRVPVYPKISATSTTNAVLNNLTRNPYAGGLAIDGEDGGHRGSLQRVHGPHGLPHREQHPRRLSEPDQIGKQMKSAVRRRRHRRTATFAANAGPP